MQAEDRRIKRSVECWMGSLIHGAAKGEVDTRTLGHRLQGIIAPIVAPEAIQEVARKAVTEIRSLEMKSLKNGMIEGCTAQKMTDRVSLYQEMLTWRPLTQEAEKPQTIGDLMQGWAELTGQNSQDFLARIHPKLAALVQDWQRRTGAVGFTDQEIFRHPQDAGEFFSGLYKILIEETPEAKLRELIATAFTFMADIPACELEAQRSGLLEQVGEFTAWHTDRQIRSTLLANPQAKAALSTSEVAALVSYEEQKQGWSGNADKAVELLDENLGNELCQHGKGTAKDAVAEALKSVGRRSLLNNLKDAVRGQLRARLLRVALDWIKKLPRIEWRVESLPDDGGIYRILTKEEEK